MEQPKKIKPSPFIGEVKAYRPPKIETPMDLRLDGNEGLPPPDELLDAVARIGIESVRRYPNNAPLEHQIAEMYGIDPASVLITAGGDDALERVIRAVLAPGREMILPVPTFEMLDRYANLTGCKIVEVPWLQSKYPLDEVLSAITDRTALIAVVSPNSPTGFIATPEDLKTLSAAAPNALILVDLAYIEFAEQDLTAYTLSLPNAVVVRSLSKAWGLAGLRTGWVAGPADVVEWLRAVGHPFAVSAPSIALASERLRTGKDQVARFVAQVREERTALTALLQKLGVLSPVLPSQGNFVFSRFKDAVWVRDALAGLGIAVRIFPGKPHLENSARITMPGKRKAFERLTHGLSSALKPEAILFDMDDTLADVTKSYRSATVATAKAFGADITFDDITEAKAAGDANNDWELTRRLLQERGIDASLETVTQHFEALYQGAGETRGLIAEESLLVDPSLLERLATKVKLGIVTGRPARDADVFLQTQGIAHLFETVVTMDDAPLKPDPAPVRLALKQLGITRAWFVGDTPDDMRAARAAGAIPLGVIAPADDPKVAKKALIRASAGRVLKTLNELEDLLP
ncbi:MAG: TIGR01548 family HAD-type hydrolase [Myxococcota bacterium]|nr:TIGR01548 family HAD-type hydrolase [Myxococcota bacterium]